MCTCLYACYLCTNLFFFCFVLFVVKHFYVLEFNNCVCKFDKNKNKNLLKKNVIIQKVIKTKLVNNQSVYIRMKNEIIKCHIMALYKLTKEWFGGNL